MDATWLKKLTQEIKAFATSTGLGFVYAVGIATIAVLGIIATLIQIADFLSYSQFPQSGSIWYPLSFIVGLLLIAMILAAVVRIVYHLKVKGRSLPASEELHNLVHLFRLDALALFDNDFFVEGTGGKFSVNRLEQRGEVEEILKNLLNDLNQLMKNVTGHDAIWSAIRVRRDSGNHKKAIFETFCRAGSYNTKRSRTSQILAMDATLLEALREDRFALRDEGKSDEYDKHPNDDLKDDVNRIAVPVNLIAPEDVKNEDRWEMVYILFVNSPNSGILKEEYVPILQCISDCISLALSALSYSKLKGQSHARSINA